MFPVLPPPFGNHDQSQGRGNAFPGGNAQLGVHNISNSGNNFTHQLPHCPFPVRNNLLLYPNVQSVVPQLQLPDTQFAAPGVAFDNRNASMQSLLGNPLTFQALGFQLNSQNQPQCLNQSPGAWHCNEPPHVPSFASHMMASHIVHGHSCCPNQVAQPGGFLCPGVIVGDSQMGSGNPAMNCNAAVVSNNVQSQNQCDLVAQLLNQNMMYLTPILAQQVPVTTGLHRNQQNCGLNAFQQSMHVMPPPAFDGHKSCPNGSSRSAVFQDSNFVAENSHMSHMNPHTLVTTMNQNGGLPSAAQILNTGMFSQQGQSPQGVQQKSPGNLGSQLLKGKMNESDGLSTYSDGGQANTGTMSSRRGYHGSGGKEFKISRFCKTSSNHMRQRRDKFVSNTGQSRKGSRNNIILDSQDRENQKSKRSISLTYTEEEILQWREERRRNYPTSSNVEKKAKILLEMQKDGEPVDENARTRRQQLKAILARQAELGVEVAEIPPGYLSDSQKSCATGHKNKVGWGSFKTKYGRKGKSCWNGKQAEVERLDDKTSPRSVFSNRKPTLLQKLLSADVERDKARLLQAFRFMTMNSFFEQWPGKPLRFPSVTAIDCDGSQKLVEEKALVNDGVGNEDVDDDDDGDGDLGAHDDGLDATMGVIKEERKVSDIRRDQESEKEEGEIID